MRLKIKKKKKKSSVLSVWVLSEGNEKQCKILSKELGGQICILGISLNCIIKANVLKLDLK